MTSYLHSGHSNSLQGMDHTLTEQFVADYIREDRRLVELTHWYSNVLPSIRNPEGYMTSVLLDSNSRENIALSLHFDLHLQII